MRRTIALAASIVLLAGCGGGSDDEEPASTPKSSGGGGSGTQTAAAGKQLFTEKCGSCHALEAAGTGGTFGPNLDDLKPDKATVLDQIERGGGGMPAGLYEGKDAETVAAYVADNAG